MRGPQDLLRTGLFLVLALYGVAAPGQSDAPADPFEQGVELTRAGRFEEALAPFLAAQAAGEDSGRLQFNLGVVYYRLQRLDSAREAFLRAAGDGETADLAHYNLGLVALAEGQQDDAARWFSQTLNEAQQPQLRDLAQAALERIQGPRQAKRGSVAVLRGVDSNVVIPVGAIDDAPSSLQDQYWEFRLGWGDDLEALLEGLGYHLSGLLVEYDEVMGADLGLAQVGLDWRGPVAVDVNAGILTVGDSGYQRMLELRMLATPYSAENFQASIEFSTALLNALDRRASEVAGRQHSLGLTFDGQLALLDWNLGARRVLNDRNAVALSPVQTVALLKLRMPIEDWTLRAWVRYVKSDYRTPRRDEATEFGLGLSWTFVPDWDLFVEGSKQRNRSTEGGFGYTSDRLYGGLRLRF